MLGILYYIRLLKTKYLPDRCQVKACNWNIYAIEKQQSVTCLLFMKLADILNIDDKGTVTSDKAKRFEQFFKMVNTL